MKFKNYIRTQIDKKVFPGISILVAQGEKICFKKHYGDKSIVPEKENLQEDTIYDIASLTKPLITSFLTVYLIERREINLNTGIKTIFPEIPFNIQIHQLLTHRSGLPAWFPFYLYNFDYRSVIKSMTLESSPGQKVKYSCPGYILLYFVIEKIGCGSFIELAKEIIIDKKKLKNTFFKLPEKQKPNTAPTEMGNRYEKKMAEAKHKTASEKFDWRTRLIRGDTHDANSYYLGGTAGNSGLFSTVSDIFNLSLEFFPQTATILRPESIQLFWKNFTPGKESHRTLGFKLNTSFFSSGGRAISPSAIGHNGFTGTSLWLEPDSRNQFILLSNRIHPVVQNLNFNRIRRRLHLLLKRDLNLI